MSENDTPSPAETGSPLDGCGGLVDLMGSGAARVARYAEAIYEGRHHPDSLGPWAGLSAVVQGYWIDGYATAAMAVADEEHAALVAEVERLRGGRDLLAQAMWDARGILGFDNDGDKTPAASLAGSGVESFAANHVREAKEQRDSYEEVLDLWDGTESREWVAHAEAAEAKVAKVEALIPAECWVSRSVAIRCTDFVGGQIGSGGAVFTLEMCCLPCRLRAALADAPAEQRAEGGA